MLFYLIVFLYFLLNRLDEYRRNMGGGDGNGNGKYPVRDRVLPGELVWRQGSWAINFSKLFQKGTHLGQKATLNLSYVDTRLD